MNWKLKNYKNPWPFRFVTWADFEAFYEKIYSENNDDGKSRT